MMRRALLILCLLTLPLTGLATGVSRGALPVVGLIELCLGQAAQVMGVDARGMPVSKLHLCPKGVGILAALGAGAPDLPAAPQGSWRLAERFGRAQLPAFLPHLGFQGRAPPHLA
ncbi:MAG: hypothetical protein ACPGNV_13010 [Mangrovicoccus sp.]